jgi:hypothetical protein
MIPFCLIYGQTVKVNRIIDNLDTVLRYESTGSLPLYGVLRSTRSTGVQHKTDQFMIQESYIYICSGSVVIHATTTMSKPSLT